MLYREIIAVCSQMHTKHINALCGQNVQHVDLMTVLVTSVLQTVQCNVKYLLSYLSSDVTRLEGCAAHAAVTAVCHENRSDLCRLLHVSARGVVVFRATWPVCAVSLFLKGSFLVVSVSSGQNFGRSLRIV